MHFLDYFEYKCLPTKLAFFSCKCKVVCVYVTFLYKSVEKASNLNIENKTFMEE
jgi:hypothetical protein